MQILFNLAFSQFYLYNLDNGARCTETSVSFTYISCFMKTNEKTLCFRVPQSSSLSQSREELWGRDWGQPQSRAPTRTIVTVFAFSSICSSWFIYYFSFRFCRLSEDTHLNWQVNGYQSLYFTFIHQKLNQRITLIIKKRPGSFR